MYSKIKAVAVVVGWAGALFGCTLWGMFQGFLVPSSLSGGGLLPEVITQNPWAPWPFYVGILTTSILAALVLSDLVTTIVSFFGAYLLAAGLTIFALTLPNLVGANYDPYGILIDITLHFTLTAFFPVPFILELFGTILGIGLAERYL